jgi:hypothetical protein
MRTAYKTLRNVEIFAVCQYESGTWTRDDLLAMAQNFNAVKCRLQHDPSPAAITRFGEQIAKSAGEISGLWANGD